MNRIYELQKKIETARHELDEALLQENRFEYYYEKSTRLDKLIEEYLGAEDFTEDIYQKTAQILFEQYHRDGKVNPAQIINLFGEEDQSEIASLFHARIAKVETKADREKALKETILRVKQNSIREHCKKSLQIRNSLRNWRKRIFPYHREQNKDERGY